MPTHKTSIENFSLASTTPPDTRSLNGPTYVRLSTMPVHVSDDKQLVFNRPILETHQATAEPDGHGRYTLYTYRRIDFQDVLSVDPESSTWTTDRLAYEPEIARAKMAKLGEAWENEGFVRDTLNEPDMRAAINTADIMQGPATPGPAPL